MTKRLKWTTEYFLEVCKDRVDLFDYSKADLENCGKDRKIDIFCKKHNLWFKQDFRNHVNGAGCPKCAKEKMASKIDYKKRNKKTKETLKSKYGVENAYLIPEIREKALENSHSEEWHRKVKETWKSKSQEELDEIDKKHKETCLKKYGVENYSQSEEFKQKIKSINLEKYGVESYLQTDEFKRKSRQTRLERYGSETYVNVDKCKETCLEKYGVENPYQSEEIKEKIRATNLKRYGVEYPMQNIEVRKKAVTTMYNSGNCSSLETYFESLLEAQGINYEYNYALDKRYPYFCDFYLPDTDTFVEINGYWVHGYHWFNKNDPKDIKTLNIWKEKVKESKFYKYAVEVWTERDVNKRQTAQENNLNYIVLWNKDDIDRWFSLNCPLGKDWINEYNWELHSTKD